MALGMAVPSTSRLACGLRMSAAPASIRAAAAAGGAAGGAAGEAAGGATASRSSAAPASAATAAAGCCRSCSRSLWGGVPSRPPSRSLPPAPAPEPLWPQRRLYGSASEVGCSPSSSSGSSSSKLSERKAIVLHHGFFGGRRIGGHEHYGIQYFRGVPLDLEEQGYDVLVTQVPATASILVRSEALAEQIAAWKGLEGRKVTILAHSMGGLDARFAISKLGLAATVDTLLTISTPHRGSPIADLLMGFGDFTGLTGLMQAMPVKFISEMPDGGRCLSVQASSDFNAKVKNDPEVRYLSVGGDRTSASRTSPELLSTYLYIRQQEGANDGLVSVDSARWGTYLQTLDMDHLHQINFPLPHRWVTKAPSYQDVVLAYRRLAFTATSGEPGARHGTVRFGGPGFADEMARQM